MSPARLAPIAVAAMLLAATAHAQNFVRVTDPTNPIVTDAQESGGGCWADLVGDGYLDLFVANGNLSNQPDALYRNTRAGGFVKVVTGPVVNDAGSGIGGTFGDFDRDGILDLFVTNRNNFGNFLYRGLGDTAFAAVVTGSPVTDVANSNSSSWVDLDRDGNLDLYVVNFGGADYLYKNDGSPGFGFTRVDTTAATPGTEASIVGGWADYNDDGYDDFFVGNAGNVSSYLYTNHGNLFFTRTVIVDTRATLGLSWGDYDNDGYLDLFIPHYLNQKSVLYHNSGPPNFTLTQVAGSAVSNDFGNWIGSGWGDYDNDGDIDLFVDNDGANNALFRNDGPPSYTFTKITTGAPVTDGGNSFGCVWGDYDRDGNLDLFVANRLNQLNFLYRNTGGTSNHWLTVRCVGTQSNTTAIGAKIRVWATIAGSSRMQTREVTGQTGYNSQNLDQHFGLGDATTVDSVVVQWPSGLREVWAPAPIDRVWIVSEGTSPLAVGGGSAAARGGLSLTVTSRNPGTGAARLSFALPSAGQARISVYDVAGRLIATPLDASLAAGAHHVSLEIPRRAGPGVYLVRLTHGGRTATTRFVQLAE